MSDGASRLGQVISGRYKIRELLGEGGMGAVYLAEHTHMRKRVALKLLHAEMKDNQEVLERFQREAQAASRIDHPNVAAATDFGATEDGGFFLVLEYVDGTSLRTGISQGRMTVVRAVHIARQIASALERAHDAGVVHRDLKPENVMLVRREDDTDFVKVLDFGIAKVEGVGRESGKQPLTKLGTLLGTPEYMAPEQALGEMVGPSADLYALGLIFYEMLTGKHPFDASDRMAVLSMHIVAPIPPMNERTPGIDVPAPIEATVKKLLEKEPKNRHDNARALIEALDAACREANISTSTPAPPYSSRESLPRVPVSQPNVDAFAKTSYGTPAEPNAALVRAKAHAASIAEKAKPIVANAIAKADDLRKTKPRVFFGALGGVAVLLIFLVAVGRCGGEDGKKATTTKPATSSAKPPPPKPSPPSKSAPDDRLRAASEQGIAALVELKKQYPEDPQIPKQLALAYHEEKKTADALRAVAAAVNLDPQSIDDALIGVVVTATTSRENSEDAFALLEGPLGERGIDALVELTTKGTPMVRQRATKALAKPEVRAKASKATAIYIDFRRAQNCPARRDLLDRVKVEADARLLPTLKQMRQTGGCGFLGTRDCWGCLRGEDTLDETIDAVQARVDDAKK